LLNVVHNQTNRAAIIVGSAKVDHAAGRNKHLTMLPGIRYPAYGIAGLQTFRATLNTPLLPNKYAAGLEIVQHIPSLASIQL
jgi:hypothetical protein